MCCIFTCCGWMLDLIQRCWVFAMSCCMCSAVCMSVMTASMSGIAMGYNYSLAEYIDMKETNVSVFLKRGIFDDDLGSDMGFRRAGHGPVSGLIKESDLVTADAEEAVIPQGSGRRLDDSVLQSNDNSNFEGSLMRLTAKPPAATEPPSTYKGDLEMGEILQKFPAHSLDQLKEIQSLMNMRKSNQRRITIDYDMITKLDPRSTTGFVLGRRAMQSSIADRKSPQDHHVYIDKAAIPIEHFERSDVLRNPARLAVPPQHIGASENWMYPQYLNEKLGRTLMFTEESGPSTLHNYPPPVRYKTDVVRPTLSMPTATQKNPTLLGPDEKPDFRRLDNSDVQVKEKLLMDKAQFPSFKKMDSKSDNTDNEKSDEMDYEEEARRGIRVRKKRNIKMSSKRVIVEESRYTLPNTLLNKYINDGNDLKPNKIFEQYKSKVASYLRSLNSSLYSSNNSKNSIISYEEDNLGNETESQTSVFGFNNFTEYTHDTFKNDTLREMVNDTLREMVNDTLKEIGNDTLKEMGTILLNKLNYSLPVIVKVKSDTSVISFLNSLLN